MDNGSPNHVIYTLGDETYAGRSMNKVREKALMRTKYKFTKLPEVPNFWCVKCSGCQDGLAPAEPHPSIGNTSAQINSDSMGLSRNGQYRIIQSGDLSTDLCHHLLDTLANHNQVEINHSFIKG